MTTTETVQVSGERQRHRAQSTGTIVVIYDAWAQDMDDSGGRWYTECVDHGCAVAHETIRQAKWFAPSPESWCETCAESDPQVPTWR